MSRCPDCDSAVSRRQFVKAVGVGATATALGPAWATAKEIGKKPAPESLVKQLFETLTPAQKEEVCFAWDHKDDRGLLRLHVSNNWNITDPKIASNFYTNDQRDLLEAIFWQLYNPEWRDRVQKQLDDDAEGFGKTHSIALFGTPGADKFELVITGRHLTVRCDGNSTEHTAFGGPIFYGHDPGHVFDEEANHANNVYWHQAVKANELFKMLDGKQRSTALLPEAPAERMVHFRAKGEQIPGIRIAELSADQKAHAQEVLRLLLEPYRAVDQEEARQCLAKNGGLDDCRLTFYQAGDIGNDGVWDNWRLEGPSFVWHYRGSPHVHVWVNVADDPNVKITTRG